MAKKKNGSGIKRGGKQNNIAWRIEK